MFRRKKQKILSATPLEVVVEKCIPIGPALTTSNYCFVCHKSDWTVVNKHKKIEPRKPMIFTIELSCNRCDTVYLVIHTSEKSPRVVVYDGDPDGPYPFEGFL